MSEDLRSTVARAMEWLMESVIPLKARLKRTKERDILQIPLTPTDHSLLGSRITTLMDYTDSAVEDLVRSLKYDGSGYAAHLCASLLADYLREELSTQKLYSHKEIYLVPVPLHKSRHRERGFNQIGLVLDRLPPEFRDGTLATLVPEALTRVRETKPQTKLPRFERLSNVAGAFELQEPDMYKDAVIFILDDVTTTGATLVNASTPFKKAGAQVHLLALARA